MFACDFDMKRIPGANDYFCSLHPATASATTELSTTDEGLSNGQIIAITFGTLTLIVTIVGSIIVPVCIEHHKKKKKNTEEEHKKEDRHNNYHDQQDNESNF